MKLISSPSLRGNLHLFWLQIFGLLSIATVLTSMSLVFAYIDPDNPCGGSNVSITSVSIGGPTSATVNFQNSSSCRGSYSVEWDDRTVNSGSICGGCSRSVSHTFGSAQYGNHIVVVNSDQNQDIEHLQFGNGPSNPSPGNCSNGADDDGDGLVDNQDCGCGLNALYNPTGSEGNTCGPWPDYVEMHIYAPATANWRLDCPKLFNDFYDRNGVFRRAAGTPDCVTPAPSITSCTGIPPSECELDPGGSGNPPRAYWHHGSPFYGTGNFSSNFSGYGHISSPILPPAMPPGGLVPNSGFLVQLTNGLGGPPLLTTVAPGSSFNPYPFNSFNTSGPPQWHQVRVVNWTLSPMVDLKCRDAAVPSAVPTDSCAIANGGRVVLTWSSSGMTSCVAGNSVADGNFVGGAATGNSNGITTNPIVVGSAGFTLNCNGPMGPASDSVTVTTGAGAIPNITMDWIVTPRNSQITSTGHSAGFVGGGASDDTGVGTVDLVIRRGDGSCAANGFNADWNPVIGDWDIITGAGCLPSNIMTPQSGVGPAVTWQSLAGQVPPDNKMTLGATYYIYYSVWDGPRYTSNWSNWRWQVVTYQNPPSPPATCTISADPASVDLGGITSLTWNTSNATACSATANPANAGWLGPKPIGPSGQAVSLVAPTTFTLNCTGAGLPGTCNTVVGINNSPIPPTATSVRLSERDYCSNGPSGTVSWTFNGSGPQTAWRVQVRRQSDSTIHYDSGMVSNALTSATVQGQSMTWNTTYVARVMVWDSIGTPSAWQTMTVCTAYPGQTNGCAGNQLSWTTAQHRYPAPVVLSWDPVNPPANQMINFKNATPYNSPTTTTTCYNSSNNPIACPTFTWNFGDGTIIGPGAFPTTTHVYTTSGMKTVNLAARDAQGYQCPSASSPLNVQLAVPEWKEVLPR